MIPSAGVTSIKILVAKADAKTLTKLLAKSIVQINFSLSLNNFSKIIAFFLPDFANVCILGFEAEVKEVSEPEKKADNKIKKNIQPIKKAKENSMVI